MNRPVTPCSGFTDWGVYTFQDLEKKMKNKIITHLQVSSSYPIFGGNYYLKCNDSAQFKSLLNLSYVFSLA